MDPNDQQQQGQGTSDSIESTAQALFGEVNPDLELGSTIDTDPNQQQVEPVQNIEPQVEPVVQQQQQQQVQQVQQQLSAEQLAQFQAWQAQQAQQQQQVQPVQQQQQQPAVQQQQQVQQAQPQQLSEEEVNRLTNRFVLDEAGYDAIFATENKADSIKALNDVLQGVARQAVTMSHYLIQEAAGGLQQKVAPYMQFADSQRELMLRETFFSRHPDLRGSDVIINAVMTQMAQSGTKFQNNEQLFDAVAQATKAQLSQLGVKGQQIGGGQQTVKPGMATLPVGSSGGSRMAQTGSGGSNTAKSLFG